MNTRRNGKNGLNASPVIPHVIPGIYLFEGLGQKPHVEALAVFVRPGSTDFSPDAFLVLTFLILYEVDEMCWLI